MRQHQSHLFHLFLLILCACVLSSCSGEKKAWQAAQQSGTIEMYEQFIQKYPKSEHGEKALEEIWKLTRMTNTMDGYVHLTQSFPGTSFYDQAVEQIWQLVKSENTRKAYSNFLDWYPNTSFAASARTAIKTLWAASKPPKPACKITSEMTVDLEWNEVEGADFYILYWAQQPAIRKGRQNSDTTRYNSIDHKSRIGEYGIRLPMYYRITAVDDSVESQMSDACLAKLYPDQGGKFCQICGEKAVGYCHLRDVYVCASDNTFVSDSGTHWRCP